MFDNNSGVNFREKEEVVLKDTEIGTLWTFHKWKTKGDFEKGALTRQESWSFVFIYSALQRLV